MKKHHYFFFSSLCAALSAQTRDKLTLSYSDMELLIRKDRQWNIPMAPGLMYHRLAKTMTKVFRDRRRQSIASWLADHAVNVSCRSFA